MTGVLLPLAALFGGAALALVPVRLALGLVGFAALALAAPLALGAAGVWGALAWAVYALAILLFVLAPGWALGAALLLLWRERAMKSPPGHDRAGARETAREART